MDMRDNNVAHRLRLYFVGDGATTEDDFSSPWPYFAGATSASWRPRQLGPLTRR